MVEDWRTLTIDTAIEEAQKAGILVGRDLCRRRRGILDTTSSELTLAKCIVAGDGREPVANPTSTVLTRQFPSLHFLPT